jgi:hypothetical protein
MKTNQEMIRPMGEFKVIQRTKDGFFCATSLLAQWNEKSGMKKEVTKFFELQSTSELVKVIMERENLNTQDSTYLKTRGKNGGTWMHPVLFIDFAMWINPHFKYDVIKFVYDEMIKFRNLAGDAYPSMCRAVRSIMPEPIFREKVKDLARSLNIIVYGKHESEMRNKIGDEAKIREMYELEKQIAQWVNIGLVGNYNQLKAALNKLYYQKYPNALPI